MDFPFNSTGVALTTAYTAFVEIPSEARPENSLTFNYITADGANAVAIIINKNGTISMRGSVAATLGFATTIVYPV